MPRQTQIAINRIRQRFSALNQGQMWSVFYALKLMAQPEGNTIALNEPTHWFTCIKPLDPLSHLIPDVTGMSLKCWLADRNLVPKDLGCLSRNMRQALEELFSEYQPDLARWSRQMLETLALPASLAPSEQARNAQLAAQVLALDATSQQVLSLTLHLDAYRPLYRLFDTSWPGPGSNQGNLGLLAALLECTRGEVMAALGRDSKLARLELVKLDRSPTDLNDLIDRGEALETLREREFTNVEEMAGAFVQASPSAQLKASDFQHMEAQFERALRWLQGAQKAGEHGVNILLYGPPGTGKSEFARLLAASLNWESAEVPCQDEDGDPARRIRRLMGYRAAQTYLSGRQDTLVVFDEIEDIFPAVATGFQTSVGIGEVVISKAWVNRMLESNVVPTVWITNTVDQLDEAYLRRFGLTIEFQRPPQHVRENIIRSNLNAMEIHAPEALVHELGIDEGLSPALVAQAARVARHTHDAGHQEGIVLEMRTLLGQAKRVAGKNTLPVLQTCTEYRLDWLNLDAGYPVDEVVQAVLRTGHGSLCLYGVPGSGKTMLAQYLADQTGKPLMVKRVSDLQSKWVGEAEKNIAQAFEEAHRAGAVFLLDECDSFLSDRSRAERRWESSQTNEFLQQIERFPGVFIATTNLMAQLDPALMRRFTFKIGFKPLTAKQRELVFRTYFGDLSLDQQRTLGQMEGLTPGDFSVVVRQAALFGQQLTTDGALERLSLEHRLRDGGQSCRVGFI